jgi:hypothetical protein
VGWCNQFSAKDYYRNCIVFKVALLKFTIILVFCFYDIPIHYTVQYFTASLPIVSTSFCVFSRLKLNFSKLGTRIIACHLKSLTIIKFLKIYGTKTVAMARCIRLKTVCNESQGGSGRWYTFGLGLGLWLATNVLLSFNFAVVHNFHVYCFRQVKHNL